MIISTGEIISSKKSYIDEFLSSNSLIGGRVAALGSSGISFTDDAFSVLYNPSLMLNLPVQTLGLEKSSLLFNTDMHSLAYVYPSENYSIGLTYITLQPERSYFIERDEFGREHGTFKVGDEAYIIGYARNITIFDKRYFFGTNIKYINKKVGNYGGQAFDIGIFTHNKYSDRIGFGVGIDNIIGSSVGNDNLPRKLRAGFYYEFDDFLVSAQTDIFSDNIVLMTGAEYNYNDILFFRLGVEDFRLTAGLGLSYSDFEFNYVFKNISTKGVSDNISLLSFGWKLGLSRKIRLANFEEYFSIAREQLILEDYGNAIRNLWSAMNVLDPKADAEQYRIVLSLKENTRMINESRTMAAIRERERNEELFNKAVELFEAEEYDLARFEFINITDNFRDYSLVLDYIQKCDEGSRRKRRQSDLDYEITTLKEAYNSAKDLQYKINIGERLLQLKPDENIENEIEKMKDSLREQGRDYDPSIITHEMSRLQQQVSRQRVSESLNRIRNFMQQGYWKLADDELMATREYLNDFTWQESLKAEIDLQLTTANEEAVFQETVRNLYEGALADFINTRLNSALNRVNRLLELDSQHTEGRNLKARIERELERTGQRVVSGEGVMLESERRLQQATIERLYQEGLSFYIAGNIQEARQRWERILEIDPDNEKVKQYLRVIR